MRNPLLLGFVGVLGALLSSAAHAQWGYGPSSGAPGQVVTMDPNAGAATPMTNNYGTANYSSYGGGAVPPPQQHALGPAAGVSNAGSMLTYGQLEGFYRYTNFDSDDLDGAHGFGMSLSAELFRPLYLKGSFNWATASAADNEDDSYDFASGALGAGAYFAITDRFHLFAEVGGTYASLSGDRSSVEFSEGALYVTPGLRFAATEALELDFSVTATSADDYDAYTVDFSGYYRLFSSMDIGIGTGIGDATQNYFAGIRFRW